MNNFDELDDFLDDIDEIVSEHDKHNEGGDLPPSEKAQDLQVNEAAELNDFIRDELGAEPEPDPQPSQNEVFSRPLDDMRPTGKIEGMSPFEWNLKQKKFNEPRTGLNTEADMPRIDVIVEYNEDKENIVNIYFEPQNMKGVEARRVEFDSSDIFEKMINGEDAKDDIKKAIISNHYSEIDGMLGQLSQNGYVKTGDSYTAAVDDLISMATDEVSGQMKKDVDKQKNALKDVDFEIDGINHGVGLETEKWLEQNVDFDVDIQRNGQEKVVEQENVKDSKGSELFTPMRAGVTINAGGRSISLGQLEYAYGYSDNERTANSLSGTINSSEIKRNLDIQAAVLAEQNIARPLWLAKAILRSALEKAIINASAKHFGVDNKKLLNPEEPESKDHRRVFEMQVNDPEVTKDEAWELLNAEKMVNERQKERDKEIEEPSGPSM